MTIQSGASKPFMGRNPATSMGPSTSRLAERSGSTGSHIEDLSLIQAQANAQAGEYWLISRRNKEPWPGVLCDEEIIRKHFKADRPINAQQPDGSFHKHFLPHDKCAVQKSFPFILLDKLKTCYVPWYRLKPIDLYQANLKSNDPSVKPALRRAYAEVLLVHDLDYWKSALFAKSLAEQQDAGSSDSEDRHFKRKRDDPVTPFRHPPRSGLVFDVDDEEDDDEDEFLKKESRSVTGQPTYRRGILDQDHRVLYEGSDSELKTNQIRSKKMRVSESIGRLTPQITPQKVKISSDMVRIYVGNPHQDFLVKRVGLEQSVLLRDMVKFQSGEAYIMSPVLSELRASDFASVAEYLDRSEYKPNLLGEGTEYARLEKVDTPNETSEAIYQCGSLHTMAEKLDLPGLQNLAIRKFRVLAPYTPEDFLLMAKLFYCSGRPSDYGLHRFMVSYASDHFYELWAAEAVTLAELLQEHPLLAQAVFQRLGGVDTKEEEEEKQEEEEKGEEDADIKAEESVFMDC